MVVCLKHIVIPKNNSGFTVTALKIDVDLFQMETVSTSSVKQDIGFYNQSECYKPPDCPVINSQIIHFLVSH